MKNFLKKWDYLLITFVLSTIIVGVIYHLQKVAPLGNNSLLTIDFYHQYGPMLSELRDRILNHSNLIYSFRMGMGLPFFRNFFNYLSSPFNILLLLFKHKDIVMSYAVIIGLKAILSSCTMGFYLNKKLGKNYFFIALSILYAFSAYFTAYYWNIMWLDGMVMLPLILYGIDELVNKNKILFYVISLALMLFANYFIGYMICIFSVLYFICEMIIETNKFNFKNIIKKCLNFGGASLLAGGLCAIFLIPLFMGLKEISATSDVFPTSQYYDFTFKEFAFNHFTGVGSTVLKSGITNAPNISVGVISIALLFLFLMNNKINFKTKIVYLMLLFFLATSFRLGPLDYIWHAFHVPNDLPFRYSFIYSFILILISAYSLKYIKDLKTTWVAVIYVITLILITLLKVLNFENIDSDMITVNYIVITIYFLCYILMVYFKKFKRWAISFMIITASLECVMVINNNWNIDHDIETYYSNYDDVKKSLNYISENDSSFYRVERLSMLSLNDPSWFGYNGQATFSSMEYENMAVLQSNLGMPGNDINSFYYKQNTPIYDLMFNIKYLLGDSVDDNRYSIFYDNKERVYKFKYTTGLMFGVNSDVKTYKPVYENAISNQNDFINKATGINDVLEKISYKKKDIVYEDDIGHTIVKYTFDNFDDNYYMYFPRTFYGDFVVSENSLYYFVDDYSYVNNYDINVYNYTNYNEKFIINNRTHNNKIEILVGYTYYNNYIDEIFEIYKLNVDKFNDVYNKMLNNKIEITNFKESNIKANSNFNENMFIYTSIPYDKGWNVYVDNKKIETYQIGNALLGFDVDKGKHSIVLKYKIPYIEISSLVSLFSLIILIIWNKFKKD